jgi:hypothetical protein
MSKAEPVLSTNLEDPDAVPYFLWDEPITVRELKARLRTASTAERLRLLAKVLREARDSDVWKFTSPEEVGRLWPSLIPRLGRRRPFWQFLLSAWNRQGLLDLNQAR